MAKKAPKQERQYRGGNNNESLTKKILFLILLVTFISFSPALFHEFTSWDDNLYVTQNPTVQELSAKTVKELFTSFQVGSYHPVTMLSFAIEYQFAGLEPFVYHFTNLLFHLLNTGLVFWIVYKLSGSTMAAAVTSVLFGIHPLHVEPVVWVSGRKEVLYTFFFLLSLIAYHRYQKEGRTKKFFLLCFVAFLLSCLSKGIGVVLPVLLLVLDFTLYRRRGWKPVIEKIPFLIISLVLGVIAYIAQQSVGATEQAPSLSLVERLIIGIYGVSFYIGKMIVPLGLSSYYPYPEDILSLVPSVVIFFLSLGAFVFVVNRYFKRYINETIIGVSFFLITILPVLQIVSIGVAIVADRFFYLPSAGLFFIIGIISGNFLDRVQTSSQGGKFLTAVTVGVIIVLSVLTWQRTHIWKNGQTLFADAVEKYPNAVFLHRHLAEEYRNANNFEKSIESYRKAIALSPTNIDPYINLADIFIAIGDADSAIHYYNTVLSMDSSQLIAYYNVGILYAKVGQVEKGISCFQQAARRGYEPCQQWLRENKYTW